MLFSLIKMGNNPVGFSRHDSVVFESIHRGLLASQSNIAVTQPGIKTRYRFEAGSYGNANNFIPSIACIKMMGEEEAYHFVLVKLGKLYEEEALAVLEATQDVEQAFKNLKTLHLSNQQFAAEWKNKGYIKVDGFNIVKEAERIN